MPFIEDPIDPDMAFVGTAGAIIVDRIRTFSAVDVNDQPVFGIAAEGRVNRTEQRGEAILLLSPERLGALAAQVMSMSTNEAAAPYVQRYVSEEIARRQAAGE